MNESDLSASAVLEVERHELEQLAEKVHHQHGWHLAESWHECMHDTVACGTHRALRTAERKAKRW